MKKPEGCQQCPLFTRGKGFVPGEVDLSIGVPSNKMRLAIVGEAPGINEALEGKPFIGKSGYLLNDWILKPVGLNREEIFIDNTLRCLPPRNKQGENYPIGEERKQAEACCRQYDKWEYFRPDCSLVSIHPAALLRSETPLPLVLEDFRKAKRLRDEGYRVRILLGAKAAQLYLPYVTEILKWRGHVQWHNS